VLPSLSEEIVRTIGEEVADYARPLEGVFGRRVRAGVEVALERFVDALERPAGDEGAWRQIYVDLGRVEFGEGRSLDALQAAYRTGARLAWRRFSTVGSEAGLPPEVLFALAEAIFAYIDELSAASIEGYAQAQSARAGERQRQREALVRLLGQEPPAHPAAVHAAAERAAWPLPRELAAVAIAEGDVARLAGRLGDEVLVAPGEGDVLALVPDPAAPGREAWLARALERERACLGLPVPLALAAVSVAQARLALRLRGGPLPAGPGLVAVEEHLPDVLLHAAPRLGEAVVRRHLGPLAALAPAVRERLEATLRAWLDHQGRVDPVAGALAVHPQTVRYRLAQLRELLGEALDRPDERFALAVALRLAEASPATFPRAV
jgi:hypothetical protein